MEALVARMHTLLGADLRSASERIVMLEKELLRERAARENVGPSHLSGSAVSRVAGPAPMKVFIGVRDATDIATWVIDAKERIYEPLKDEAAASGRTWTALGGHSAVRTGAVYQEEHAKSWYAHLARKPGKCFEFWKSRLRESV
ncbi:hypothetical protein FVE85_4799 [Porphyridium purpureum]|uniref:Uncharacterized protein n=1 Tax=Porphyridium purpureum TaxID=35688 RepID=A0A5J4YS48_PORPP|nr:hypothetical protein FVE85_4610 [Porphyridium purpureum]KAA8493662.1 hypothetical protein FVE85_4799 [Porphyridium purpureum]|eukprot:POR8063..scf236_6